MAELDVMVLECAGSVLGPFVAVVGGAVIIPHLQAIVQLLLGKLVSELRVGLVQALLLIVTEKQCCSALIRCRDTG